MPYLQLADDNYNTLAEGSILNNYLTIPPGYLGNKETKMVRIDYFDNLPTEQFALTMAQLAPYQKASLLSAGGENLLKIASFGSKFIPGIGPLVSKAVDKAGPMAVGLIAKLKERKKNKGGKTDPGTDPGTDITKKTEEKGNPIPPITIGGSVGNQDFALQYNPNDKGNQAQSFFKRYQTPIIIGSVVLIGGIFLLTRKKSI